MGNHTDTALQFLSALKVTYAPLTLATRIISRVFESAATVSHGASVVEF